MAQLVKWPVQGVSMSCTDCGTVWDPTKAMDVEEWLICDGGRLDRIYYIMPTVMLGSTTY